MDAARRRKEILAALQGADGPISAAALAERFGVSRQVIVGDVALMRAGGADISATPRGYVSGGGAAGQAYTVACLHAPEEMEAELNLMVDNGCTVLDVVVEHALYGQLTGPLHLTSRYEVGEFLRRVAESGDRPLSALTGGVHLHTLRCPDGETFLRTRAALARAGFLYENENGE